MTRALIVAFALGVLAVSDAPLAAATGLVTTCILAAPGSTGFVRER